MIAKVPSRTNQANVLIFLWGTALKSYFLRVAAVNGFLRRKVCEARGSFTVGSKNPNVEQCKPSLCPGLGSKSFYPAV